MKKVLIKIFSAVLSVAVILSAVAVVGVSAENSDLASAADVLTIENSTLSLSLDNETGFIKVTDKVSGKVWHSNPPDAADDEKASGVTRTNLLSQIIIKYKDGNSITSLNSNVGSVKRGDAVFTASENKIKAVYTFEKAEIIIPVIYSIEDNTFAAEISVNEIEEKGSFQLNTIELLPFFGAGGLKDNGYIFVPDGSGAIIEFNNGKSDYTQYSKPVYGEDKTLASNEYSLNEEKISIPLFGIKNENSAYAAFISKGAESANINALVSGYQCSYNRAYASFTYRSVETLNLADHTGKDVTGMFTALKPVQNDNFKVEYTLINGSEAAYNGMAKVLRNKLKAERIDNELKNRLVLDFYGATNVEKAFLGIRYTGTQALTTYSQALDILKELNSFNINNIDVGYKFFNSSSVKKSLSVNIKPWSKLGGNKEFKELNSYCSEKGINLYPLVNFHEFSGSTDGFVSLWDSALGLDLVSAKVYKYSTVTRKQDKTSKAVYLLPPEKFSKAESKIIKSINKNNISALSFEGVTSSLYSNFAKNGYLRDRALAETNKILKNLADSSVDLMMSNPNYYAYKYASVITELPMKSSGYKLFDKDVPFIQMVLHGVVDYTAQAANIQGISEKQILDSVSLGAQLKFSIIAENGEAVENTELDYLYSSSYVDRKEDIKNLYQEVSSVTNAILDSAIVSYDNNGSTAVTEYENGVKIVVNYSNEEIELDGNKIGSMSYIVIR